jgi:hypothetical protein
MHHDLPDAAASAAMSNSLNARDRARGCICPSPCPMTDDRHWINCPAHEYYAGYLAMFGIDQPKPFGLSGISNHPSPIGERDTRIDVPTKRSSRLALFARQILISVDQLAQVVLVGPFYVAGITDACPSADETISSYVGRGQMRGAWWARLLAPAIDALFLVLGDERGHCRRNVETAFLGLPPTA